MIATSDISQILAAARTFHGGSRVAANKAFTIILMLTNMHPTNPLLNQITTLMTLLFLIFFSIIAALFTPNMTKAKRTRSESRNVSRLITKTRQQGQLQTLAIQSKKSRLEAVIDDRDGHHDSSLSQSQDLIPGQDPHPHQNPNLGNEDGSPSQDGPIPNKLKLADIISDTTLTECLQLAKKLLFQTATNDDATSHSSLVCVVCDRNIPPTDDWYFMSQQVINQHRKRLGVREYEDYHRVMLPESLKSQYSLSGCPGMLLSPRARDKAGAFSCCSQCRNSMRKELKGKSPPKHAIANGFAIGAVPDSIIAHDHVTDLLSSLIAPVRSFSFLFSYTGGAQKTIRGQYQFFQNNVQHAGSVLNHYQTTVGGNPNVYVLLCGRFTPKQRRIAKEKACLDTREYLQLLRWLIQDSGHPAFKNLKLPEDCPQPVYVDANATPNNTDEEVNPQIEETFEGGRFYFPSAHQPVDGAGTFGTEEEFARAMLDGTSPTLLFHGGNYANERESSITDMFPIQFPYGQGEVGMRRRTKISPKECLKHYCNMSLPQMHRPDFVLVVTSMYARMLAFDTGFIKCKAKVNGATLAERVSNLTPEDISRAAARRDDVLPVGGTSGQFLNAVSTSCRSIGYTNEAAAEGRRKFFAMGDYFGESSLFLSITPDDQNSLRVKLYATAAEVCDHPCLLVIMPFE